MELLSKLGINWKLLIAQLVNFAILLYVLKRFAYKPIVKMLNERASKIERGLKDAEEARKKLSEVAQQEKEILAKARAEAQEILKKAEDMARKNKEDLTAEAKAQAEKILADAKADIETEKVRAMKEIRDELAHLVVLATEKVVGEKIDPVKDRELIEKAIR